MLEGQFLCENKATSFSYLSLGPTPPSTAGYNFDDLSIQGWADPATPDHSAQSYTLEDCRAIGHSPQPLTDNHAQRPRPDVERFGDIIRKLVVDGVDACDLVNERVNSCQVTQPVPLEQPQAAVPGPNRVNVSTTAASVRFDFDTLDADEQRQAVEKQLLANELDLSQYDSTVHTVAPLMQATCHLAAKRSAITLRGFLYSAEVSAQLLVDTGATISVVCSQFVKQHPRLQSMVRKSGKTMAVRMAGAAAGVAILNEEITLLPLTLEYGHVRTTIGPLMLMPMKSVHHIIVGLPSMIEWGVNIDTPRGSLTGHYGRTTTQVVHSLEAVDERLPLVASLVVTDGRRILLRAEHGRPELPATYIGTDPPADHRSGGVIRLMAKLGLTGGSALVPLAVFKCYYGAGDFLQMLYVVRLAPDNTGSADENNTPAAGRCWVPITTLKNPPRFPDGSGSPWLAEHIRRCAAHIVSLTRDATNDAPSMQFDSRPPEQWPDHRPEANGTRAWFRKIKDTERTQTVGSVLGKLLMRLARYYV